jgi:hypothetical protein
VLDAYTDFSDRRLHTWRDTLKPGNYALLEQGPMWAVVREGSLDDPSNGAAEAAAASSRYSVDSSS